jgi:uncharacterized membrane protein
VWTDAILAYLHFAAIFTLVWFLAKEWTLLRVGAEKIDLERIALAAVFAHRDAFAGRRVGIILSGGNVD